MTSKGYWKREYFVLSYLGAFATVCSIRVLQCQFGVERYLCCGILFFLVTLGWLLITCCDFLRFLEVFLANTGDEQKFNPARDAFSGEALVLTGLLEFLLMWPPILAMEKWPYICSQEESVSAFLLCLYLIFKVNHTVCVLERGT